MHHFYNKINNNDPIKLQQWFARHWLLTSFTEPSFKCNCLDQSINVSGNFLKKIQIII